MRERISKAAFKVHDRVYTGTHHGEAYEAAIKAGENSEAHDWEGVEEGFVTDSNRFVNRHEATRIASKSKQLSKAPSRYLNTDGLHVGDIKGRKSEPFMKPSDFAFKI